MDESQYSGVDLMKEKVKHKEEVIETQPLNNII
jgi:hypothetical protein